MQRQRFVDENHVWLCQLIFLCEVAMGLKNNEIDKNDTDDDKDEENRIIFNNFYMLMIVNI